MISDLILRSLLGAASAIPPEARGVLARSLGSLEFRVARGRRRAVLANLGRIARTRRPELLDERARARAARSVFQSYHRALLEFLAQDGFGRAAIDRDVRVRGAELLHRALARGRGAVIAAPHVGSWELAGVALARLGFLVHVVTGIQFHRRITGAVRRLKERARIRVSTPAGGFTPLLGTLREGGIVVLLADGDVFARSVPAPFFGDPVPFPAGPALLARRARVPIVHGHAAHAGGGRHILSFTGLDEPDYDAPLRADLVRLTSRVAAALEQCIADHVDQWCLFRPVFEPPDAA